MLTATALSTWLSILGYPEAIPTDDREAVFVGLQGVISTTEKQADGSILTHEGQLSAVWQGGNRYHLEPSSTVVLQRATGSQAQLGGDDMVLALWMEGGQLLLAGSRGKVNADRQSAGNTQGAAQLADGLHHYLLSNFGYDASKPEVFRAVKRLIVVLRDLNVDGETTFAELIAAGLSLKNLSVLMHAMGLSEGCWGPLSAAWPLFLRLGKAHLALCPAAELPCLMWHGADLLRWMNAGQPLAWQPELRPGCRGRWVNQLQGLLINAGADLKPDSLFGPATARAFLSWRQRTASPLTVSRVVALDWAALGAPLPEPSLPSSSLESSMSCKRQRLILRQLISVQLDADPQVIAADLLDVAFSDTTDAEKAEDVGDLIDDAIRFDGVIGGLLNDRAAEQLAAVSLELVGQVRERVLERVEGQVEELAERLRDGGVSEGLIEELRDILKLDELAA
jgi:hypothetical protein